jgi:hypothetical protein
MIHRPLPPLLDADCPDYLAAPILFRLFAKIGPQKKLSKIK